MLYGNDSISHYSRSNVAIWMTLALQAGALNVAGFMGCHRFVSHITGFAAFMGYEVSEAHYGKALGMLAVPAFFLFGAMLSGQLVDIRSRRKRRPNYYVVFGLIFFLVMVVLLGGTSGLFGIFGGPLDSLKGYLLLALLCLTCGIQNGTITTVSRSVVRTTHLTGLTTDLGIGLVRVLNGENVWEEVRANLMRVGIVLFFALGSIAEGIACSRYGYGGLVLPAATSGALFLLMLYHQVLKKPMAA